MLPCLKSLTRSIGAEGLALDDRTKAGDIGEGLFAFIILNALNSSLVMVLQSDNY